MDTQDRDSTENVAGVTVSGKQETILLAEDDRFVSDIYKRKLSEDGYRVLHAQNGREATEFLEKEIPDLILLDIMMPVMNGIEVLESIKKEDRLKDIPVIMLTNLAEREQIEKCTSLGSNGYIVKAHFTPSEVTERVREMLNKCGAEHENTRE